MVLRGKSMREIVNKAIIKIKRNIEKMIQEEYYGNALSLVELASEISYFYNQFYYDDDLENYLRVISKKFLHIDVHKSYDRKTVLFYDGFGENTRGLALIYVKALCKNFKVIYVTEKHNIRKIPSIVSVIEEYNCCIRTVNASDYLGRAEAINKIIKETTPGVIFMYTTPSDVVMPMVMHAYKGVLTRFQINLTDHAFWLGADSCDYCIEFRDYGAYISNKYRRISKDKILMLPFYPIIDYGQVFLGYPFDADESRQKIVFSGGSLYKTKGGNGLYYKIVRHILDNHKDVVFWYAGFGDRTDINQILKEYPGRAFLTNERPDLYQVLRHSCLYLSTYPVCGGLMFQYAALAKKPPITLKFGDVTDGFLIEQDLLGIQFDNFDDVINEIDRLLSDEEYLNKKAERVYKSVINPDVFESQLVRIIEFNKTDFRPVYKKVSIKCFLKEYEINFNEKELNDIIYRSKKLIVLKLFTKRFLLGKLRRMLNKIMRLLR